MLGERRVGHAGTLDPDATGVLLLGVGSVTRLLRFLTERRQAYVGEVVLGARPTPSTPPAEVTATYDMATRDAGRRARPSSPSTSRATSCRCRRWCRR